MIAAYKALFKLKNNVKKKFSTNKNKAPEALVFIHQQDETLKGEKVSRLLKQWNYTKHWKVKLFNNKNEPSGNHSHGTSHLMIDSFTLGEIWWKEVSQDIKSFLSR